MSDLISKMAIDIECLSMKGIQDCFDQGLSVDESYRGQPLIYELITGYARGVDFSRCIHVFVDNGVTFEDNVLLAVLKDNAAELKDLLSNDKKARDKKYTISNAFTQMHDVSLLHIAVEYNHLSCIRVLLDCGLDPNIRAGYDPQGNGGQTPIFHAVNQHNNFNIKSLELLLEYKASVNENVSSLVWGEDREWETYIPAINPISYAMMGLLRQFQRKEHDIYTIVKMLQQQRGIDYEFKNIPNKYLQ